jgi:type I restriction enzyme M protein
MAIKKSELYSSLWASCDALRGGMDASQYKDYILTLLFVKYVSDKFTGVDYADIEIPEGGSFSDMIALIGKDNIGEGINKVIAKLAEENNLRGVIDKVSFNDPDKLGKGKEMVDKLSKLINIFRRPELDFSKNRTEGDDLIGDAYEYLMRKFATESGKSKGQFYTPAEVSRVLAKVIGISHETNPNATICDPACGSGSLLIRALEEAPVALSGYGQEKDTTTAGLAKMNTVLHNKATATIRSGNTFSDPQYFENGSDETVLRRFDYIVANPPFSLKNWSEGAKEYGRFEGYGDRPPEKNGDYAWLLHILKSLKNTGKAAVILPHGVLFRGNAEATIRQNIIERGWIKGIIGLPANLFYGTGIPACIIVIDKEDADDRKGIFMIDASRDFVKDGNKNRLRERDIYKIVTTFNEQLMDDPHYARFVPKDEIVKKNGYNLNISRYIDSGIAEDLQDIDAHLNGGIPMSDVDKLTVYWNVFGNLKSKLFSVLRDGYYKLNVEKENIRTAIYDDAEFSSYADKIDEAFTVWRDEVDHTLRSINSDVNAKELIVSLAEKILTAFEGVELIDKYDVYQVLLAYWQEVMSDDVYLLIHDGYLAGRELSYEYVVKTEKKGEETITTVTDKVKSWDGKLIPKAILTSEFFSEEKKAIDDITVIISDLQAQADEFEEEQTGEDGVLADCLNDKNNLDQKVVKERLKKLKTEEQGGEDYKQLKEYSDLLSKIKDHNKTLKELSALLEQNLKAKYAVLTEDEIKELLVNKKWYYSIYDGIDALYTSISHNLSARITELAERYESTLPELEKEFAEYEAKVKAHLKQMGFEL